MSLDSDDKTIRLIAKVLSGNASKAEEDEFKSIPQEKIRAYQQLWVTTAKLCQPKLTADLWPGIYKRIQTSPVNSPDLAPAPRFWRSASFQAAAMIFVLFLSAFLWRTISSDKTTVATGNAETKFVHLPDGSEVQLNAASSITYSLKHRKVRLSGEAFFQVKPDEEPFVVGTGNARITVLGTAFDVRAREQKIIVAVERGHVQLENIRTGNHVVLAAGEMSRMQGIENPTAPAAADLDVILAWRRGRLVFDRTPVAEVLEELTRTYDVSLRIKNIDTANLTLTASFEKGVTITDVLSAVCLTFDWEFRQTKGGFELFKRGEQK